MIVAEPKPIKEILDMVKDYKKVLIIGCKGCVTVCNVGGSKEVGILAENPKFNEVSHGAFKDGRVIPYIRNQIGAVGDFISRTD